MKRRDFFRRSVPGILLPSLLNGFSLRAWAASPISDAIGGDGDSENILVLVQLNGGNDGLNMVIPLEFYDCYQAARANIAIPENRILRLGGNDRTGLHPAMTGLQNLYNEGKLSIVQAVGYPKPSFSHFRATDIWLSGADSTQSLPTGWAGRYLNEAFPDFPKDYPNPTMPDPLAIQVGSIVSPALQGPVFSMGMAISNTDNFYNLINGLPSAAADTRAGDQLAYIRDMSVKTDQYAGVIRQAAQKVKTQSDKYPAPGKNPLADQLKIVARLIGGGLRTRLYMVSMGGFDTHAKQTEAADTSSGNHARLLAKFSEAVSAFMDDLKQQGSDERVIGMSFSEFGRRIRSNASGGTDHGAAAPVLLFGKRVNPGILGENPVIPVTATVNDNIPMQFDFRSLYSTIMEKWFALGDRERESVLLKSYPLLPLFRNA